ncbi:MAG: fucose isomerase [Clostridia bacterium]|nr:fucose isomerase [Clostridia bacterium]
MTMFQTLYLPIGVPTFDLTAAGKVFEASAALLRAVDAETAVPQEMLLGLDKLNAFTEDKCPDLVVLQNVTFANGAYTAEVLRRFDCPVLLWTPQEPAADTGRLKLNALTGAYSAANMLSACRRPFNYVYGAPEDPATAEAIRAVWQAAKLKKALRSLTLLQIGYTPEGFGFGRALDHEITRTFGARLLSIEARELIDRAKSFSDADVQPYLEDARKRICKLDSIDEKNVLDFARLYKAYAEYIRGNRIGAVASRCWPDFFVSFGTPVCAVLAMLNDLGVPAACETDTYGALSMYFAAQLTGKPAFFGDPVALNKEENTVTFWHCGTAACSLAREDTGAEAGVHCNRRIGPTLEFGCKAAPCVTIVRLGRDADGNFRLLTAKGEALDRPKQYFGTSVVVRTACDAEAFVRGGVEYGWEPHFAVAMGDISAAVKALGNMLGIEVFSF